MMLTLSMNPNGSFFVHGNRQLYKNEMSTMGGRWNRNGWLFPRHQFKLVEKFVEQANIDYVQYYPSVLLLTGLYMVGGLIVFACNLYKHV